MTYTLYCVKYKSYLNREMRSLWTADAFEIADPNYYSETGIRNFNFGDGIITTQVINHNVEDKDYAVLMDETTNIISRWYIIECKYSRYNQYELTLMRDLLFDYQEEIANSTVYIENAMLNRYNPLIYSKEPGVTVNQILTDRVPLKDATGIPWVVGYVKKDASTQVTGEHTVIRDDVIEGAVLNYASSSSSNWKFASLSTTEKKVDCTSFSLNINMYAQGLIATNFTYKRSEGGEWTEDSPSSSRSVLSSLTLRKDAFKNAVKSFVNANQNGIKERIRTGTSDVISNADRRELEDLEGRIIKFTDGYYRLAVVRDSVQVSDVTNTTANTYIVGNLQAMNPNAGIESSGANSILYSPTFTTVKVTLTLQKYSSIKYTIAENSSRLHTVDSTYDVVCAPYGAFTFNSVALNDPEASLAVMQDMAGSKDNVEDVQILPYCPLDIGTTYTMDSTDEHFKYDWITDAESSNTKIGVIIYCSSSSVKKRVNNANLSNKFYLQAETEAIPFKTQVQCNFIRLTNGSSMYEMGIAQNEGIKGFSIAMTCLPINPYIHIIPDFGGIYGHTYEKDERGLILGGNFSVAQMSDAWKNYQTQNKNFEAIFDRQTTSLDLQNKWSNFTDISGAVVGAIQGAGTGAIMGSGLPGGQLVGGAIGGAFSAGAGVVDVIASRQIREDNYNARLDIHNLELGNIQALPQTLTRQTSFNVDSMYFPVLEYYTCRSEEMEAFRNKILWDGMTVGVIGNINDYEGYVKCRLIRCPSIGDYHTVQAINEELKKGVYR